MWLTRTASICLAGVVAGAGVALAAPAGAAQSKIQITSVRFDSAGSDKPVTNAKLNDEYVVIKNTDSVTRSLKNWTLRDVANHRYTFPATSLKPGATLKVHTGKGTDGAGHRYMGRGYYVWNNTSDTAYLRTTSGGGGDTCSWTTSDPGSTKRC